MAPKWIAKMHNEMKNILPYAVFHHSTEIYKPLLTWEQVSEAIKHFSEDGYEVVLLEKRLSSDIYNRVKIIHNRYQTGLYNNHARVLEFVFITPGNSNKRTSTGKTQGWIAFYEDQFSHYSEDKHNV